MGSAVLSKTTTKDYLNTSVTVEIYGKKILIDSELYNLLMKKIPFYNKEDIANCTAKYFEEDNTTEQVFKNHSEEELSYAANDMINFLVNVIG